MALRNNLGRFALFGGLTAWVVGGAATLAPASEKPMRLPAPAVELPGGDTTRSIVLAGGCFWGLQGMFEHVNGVTRVTAGYAGGEARTAHYDTVASGATGHAEAVKIEFDPRVVSYGRLLQLFFSVAHDPTQRGGQGPDEGSQYRSAIFVAEGQQRQVAQRYIAQLEGAGVFRHPITTELEPLRGFFPAEGYHQDYLIRHPDSMYIAMNDLPKISALRNLYPDLYRATPVTAGAEQSRS